jgi:spore coat polysaccharide biosynthesis protein SpsF
MDEDGKPLGSRRTDKAGLKFVATIEARMGSTRLPGKVLLPANGQPLLGHLVNRLKQVPTIESIVLATTVNKRDDVLGAFAESEDILCYRGSEDDVVGRVIGAGESVNTDVVVGFTGDCPVVDPVIVEQTIQMFLNNDCEYVSTGYIPSYPAGVGDNHVFLLETLKRSSILSDDIQDRENVGMHIHKHPELFAQIFLVGPADLSWPEVHLLLDTPEDYELLRRVVEHFGSAHPYFGCREVIALLRSKPDWVALNRRVGRTLVPDGRPALPSMKATE